MSFKLGFFLGLIAFVFLSILLSFVGTIIKVVLVIVVLFGFIWFCFSKPFSKNACKR